MRIHMGMCLCYSFCSLSLPCIPPPTYRLRPYVCYHDSLAVPPQCIPQHAGQLGLAVRHVRVMLAQGVHGLLQERQRAVDELSLTHALA